MKHAFVIPAYKESPYLATCIESLLSQKRQDSLLKITTSTPCTFLDRIADNYHIPLEVNPNPAGIAADWNFALNASNAELVTLAHQDDVYDEHYTELMRAAIRSHPRAILVFSDFQELTPFGPRPANLNIRIKRMLCARAFGAIDALDTRRTKRRLLSLGNPVCCPSVLIHRANVPAFCFTSGLKSNLDWEAWTRMADVPGQFVYVRNALVSKRIHVESETSVLIARRDRRDEDQYMFERFWSKPVAAVITSVYKLGYLGNRV